MGGRTQPTRRSRCGLTRRIRLIFTTRQPPCRATRTHWVTTIHSLTRLQQIQTGTTSVTETAQTTAATAGRYLANIIVTLAWGSPSTATRAYRTPQHTLVGTQARCPPTSSYVITTQSMVSPHQTPGLGGSYTRSSSNIFS